MRWQFWTQRKGEMIPENVRKVLASQHHLSPDALKALKSVSKPGSRAGVPVEHIRIYDFEALDRLSRGMSSKVTFDTISDYKEVLLFEGHMQKDGYVYLADRRRPIHTGNSKTANPSHQINPGQPLGGKEHGSMAGQTQKPGQTGKPGQTSKPAAKPTTPKK